MQMSISFLFGWIWLSSIFVFSTSCAGKNQPHRSSFDFLQNELQQCSESQKGITQFLKARKVFAGPISSTSHDDANCDKKLITSTKDNEVICRITLDRAPIGSKCIAPCACTGSQKWVQFSVINKLRRKDPTQWSVCQTCRQPFMFNNFIAYGGLSGGLIAFVIDHIAYFRTASILGLLVLGYFLSIPSILKQILVSKTLWQMFPQWSKIVHIPFALKIWIGKMITQYIVESYLYFEKNTVISRLAEIESALIEQGFPDNDTTDNSDSVTK